MVSVLQRGTSVCGWDGVLMIGVIHSACCLA